MLLHLRLLHLRWNLDTRKCNNPRKCNNFSHFVIVTTHPETAPKMTKFDVLVLLGSISMSKSRKFNIDQKVVILTTHPETAQK